MAHSRRISWRSRLRFGRRRVWVGKFTDPPLRPLLPLEEVVADGVALTLSAVRLSIKNRIIVGALRDHTDFDTSALSTFAHEELTRLADESDETASRLERQPHAEPPDPSEPPVRLLAHRDRARRFRVERALALALRTAATNDALLDEVVSNAQDSASDELRRALSSRLVSQRFDLDPNYLVERATRLRAFKAIDLDQLREPPTY